MSFSFTLSYIFSPDMQLGFFLIGCFPTTVLIYWIARYGVVIFRQVAMMMVILLTGYYVYGLSDIVGIDNLAITIFLLPPLVWMIFYLSAGLLNKIDAFHQFDMVVNPIPTRVDCARTYCGCMNTDIIDTAYENFDTQIHFESKCWGCHKILITSFYKDFWIGRWMYYLQVEDK